jgi:hypothetical protein
VRNVLLSMQVGAGRLSQAMGVPAQTPDVQLSAVVHASPSLQLAPFANP